MKTIYRSFKNLIYHIYFKRFDEKWIIKDLQSILCSLQIRNYDYTSGEILRLIFTLQTIYNEEENGKKEN